MVVGAYLVFHSGENAEFAFHRNVELVGIVHNLLRQGYVFLEGQVAAVDHHGRKSVVHAVLAHLEAVAVVKVKHDLRMLPAKRFGIFYRPLGHVAEEDRVGIVARALRHLEDYRRFGFGRSLDDGLELLHVVEVERGDGIAAMYGFGKHLAGVDQAK